MYTQHRLHSIQAWANSLTLPEMVLADAWGRRCWYTTDLQGRSYPAQHSVYSTLGPLRRHYLTRASHRAGVLRRWVELNKSLGQLDYSPNAVHDLETAVRHALTACLAPPTQLDLCPCLFFVYDEATALIAHARLHPSFSEFASQIIPEFSGSITDLTLAYSLTTTYPLSAH